MVVLALLSQVFGDWPMWGGEPSHRALQLMRGAMDEAPIIKWGFATGDWVEWQFSAIADVDGDGQAEVVIGSFDDRVYCLNGATGAEEWSFLTNANINSSPAVADVDGDGQTEVLVGSSDRRVYCLNGVTGAEEWSFLTGGGVISSPAIADVDGDGQVEVLVGSYDFKVYCLNGTTGTQEWSFLTGGRINSSPAVADVDGDGQMEVVVGSDDHRVYCLSGPTGAEEWSFLTGDTVFGSPAIADVDGDGQMEVVIGSQDNRMYCINGSTGGEEWSFVAGDKILSSPALADVDGDGNLEIIFGSQDATLHCLDGATGSEEWARSFPGATHTPGSLADIDGDGMLEFLVPQGGRDTLYCLNAENGSLLWKVALSPSLAALDIHSPFVGDIDGDGCVEIVTGTQSTNPDGYRIFALDDPDNSSDCGLAVSEGSEAPPSPILKPYPHGLYLFLPQAFQVKLTLYDATGRLVRVLYNGVLSQGAHTFPLNGLKRGVYTAILRSGGEVERVKVVR